MASPQRVLIIDPTLRGRAGHAYHASRAIIDAVKSASLEPVVLTSACFKDDSDQCDIYQPAFSTNLSNDTNLYNRKDWTFAYYEKRAEVLRLELAKAIRSHKNSVCAVIMPTCEQSLIKALSENIRRRELSDTVGILGWLLFPPRWNVSSNDPDTEIQVTEYQDAITSLRSFLKEGCIVKFCCETQSIKTCYERVEGLDLGLAALPSLAKRISTAKINASQQSGVLHFVTAGHVTPAKGYETLPGALFKVPKSAEKTRFTIHGVVEDDKSPSAMALAKASQLGPHVTVLNQALTSEKYYELLESADVLLLPYKMPEYEHRGSGIFNESVELGIPVIAPIKSDFARLAIEHQRAVPIRNQGEDGIVEAILEVCRNFEKLRDNCIGYRNVINGAQSTTSLVDKFIDDTFKYNQTTQKEVVKSVFKVPKFTVIISNYNYSEYITECLNSVIKQTHIDWECIIVDDNSTDESRKIIEEYVERVRDKRFKTLFLKKNVGQIGAMKAGLRIATGRFVGFLDADDLWTPDYIKAHLHAHLNHDFSAGMSCSDMLVVDDEGHLLCGTWMGVAKSRGGNSVGLGKLVRPLDSAYTSSCAPQFDASHHAIVYIQQTFPARWLFSPTSGCVFRRELLELMQPSSGEHFAISADYYFNMQASVLTGFLLIDAPLAIYRMHNRNGYSKNPVVGGSWRPGEWSVEISEAYNYRIVEHIKENLTKYERIFGIMEIQDAIRKIIGNSSNKAVPTPIVAPIVAPAQGPDSPKHAEITSSKFIAPLISSSRTNQTKSYKRHIARWKRSIEKRLLRNY